MGSIYQDCIEYVKGLADKALKGETAIVTIGGTTVQQPAEFLVREVPESVTFSDRSTSCMGRSGARGLYRVEFNVVCETWCKKATLTAASYTVLGWMQALFSHVAADKTLGGLCVHAEPYFESAGSSRDSTNKQYIAAIDFGIHVKADIDPASDL